MTTEQTIRNNALEEAAHLLETEAGEFMNDGPTFRQCAGQIRLLKTCPTCGQKMFKQWDGKDWQPHSCPK